MFEDFSDLLGKPYKEDGRGPDEYDCFGLCIEVLRRVGIMLPQEVYSHNYESLSSTIIEAKTTNYTRLEKPEPYCLVVFIVTPPLATHVGIVLKDCKRFINTREKVNVCIEKLRHPFWKSRLDGFYRYKTTNN